LPGDSQGKGLNAGVAAAPFEEQEGVQAVQQTAIDTFEGGSEPPAVG